MKDECIHKFVKRYSADAGRSLADANDSADKAIQKIKALNVTPNPIHYSLIYEVFNQIDPYLADKVQHAIDTKTYDNNTAEDIFVEMVSHFLHEPLPTEEVRDLLNGLLEQIEYWINGASTKQATLNNEINFINEQELSPEVRRRLNDSILPTLKGFMEDTDVLHQQILYSSNEIKQLKNDLEQAQAIAKTDDLTKIPNRRGFNEIILQVAKVAQAEQSSFALILLDIDFFKTINDDFGHLIGDSVLRFLAQQLDSETKGKDRVARFGGEEFVVILPNTSYDDAIHVANDLRKKIAGNNLKVKSHDKPLRLTISAGVTTYQMGEDVDKLIDRADKSLYQAKNTGRNKVCGEHG